MTKSCAMALLLMISFLLVVGRSSGRLLMKNTLLNSPDSQLAFDPSLNSIVDDESTLHTADDRMEKNTVDCHQERSSSAKSATTENKASSAISRSIQKTKKLESSALKKAKGVFHLLQKVNSLVTEQRIAASGKSPGVGHMQTHQSRGDNHLQEEKSNKRKLGSTPSPGGGH